MIFSGVLDFKPDIFQYKYTNVSSAGLCDAEKLCKAMEMELADMTTSITYEAYNWPVLSYYLYAYLSNYEGEYSEHQRFVHHCMKTIAHVKSAVTETNVKKSVINLLCNIEKKNTMKI